MKAGRIGTRLRTSLSPINDVQQRVGALLVAVALAVAGTTDAHALSPAPAATATSRACAEDKGHAAGQTAKPKNAGTVVSTIQDQRRQQIRDECADLFKMATALKAAVDKTTKDELSVKVVRQADHIEKLAHTVKDQMRPAVKRP